MSIIKADDFVAKVKNIAQNYNTVYCWGSFGFPINENNIKRLESGYPKIYTENAKNNLRSLIGKNYFGFDCVGLIKGVLWGWNADRNKSNGGTSYCTNGVNDIDCNAMFELCSGKSADFSDIVPGEFLWMQGHIGVYIGNGLAVEATASWENKVQITAVGNIGAVNGYRTRRWTKHGKSPFIDYSVDKVTKSVNANSVYRSLGVAAKRDKASTKGSLKGRCVKGQYYLADEVVTLVEVNQKWFRHMGTGLYSALTDTDGSKLFEYVGMYKAVKANAYVRVRTGAGLNYKVLTTLSKGTTLYTTGKEFIAGGICWVQVVYDGRLCWCDKNWITI